MAYCLNVSQENTFHVLLAYFKLQLRRRVMVGGWVGDGIG